jgi:hypothetical protein
MLVLTLLMVDQTLQPEIRVTQKLNSPVRLEQLAETTTISLLVYGFFF